MDAVVEEAWRKARVPKLPPWRQPFVRGYVAGAFVAGLVIASWLIVRYPHDFLLILAIFLGGAVGSAIASALACGWWPGYHASSLGLVVAALLLNPATYLLSWALSWAILSSNEDFWIYSAALVLSAMAPVVGTVLRRERKR
jgi:hypothetical protein